MWLVWQARKYEEQGADELVMLDISATPDGRATTKETVKAIRGFISLSSWMMLNARC
jgi:imidazole glycerol phosphate synthase subunit HisF